MQKTPPNAVAIAEPNPTERLTGLLGAMLDGYVEQFEHENLIVRKSGGSIEVCDQHERPLGGYCLMNPASLTDLLEWVENKVEFYQ